MERRNIGIDYVRCLMAILIMMYHYTYRYFELFPSVSNKYMSHLKYGGTIGVAIFFVISSFYSMNTDYSDAKCSFVKKIIRLYPAYLLAVIIIYIVVKITNTVELEVSVLDLLMNIILIARYLGRKLVDGAHWYVYFLIVFYAWHILLNKLGLKKKYWPYIVWLVLSSITSQSFMEHFGLNSIVYFNHRIESLCTVLFLERYSSYIIIGVMIFFIVNKIGVFRKSITLLFVALVRNIFFVPYSILIIITFLCVILFLMFSEYWVLPQNHIVNWFAPISYSFYLIHQNIGYVVFQFQKINSFGKWIVAICTAIGLSILLACFIDKVSIVMQRCIKNIIQRLRFKFTDEII